MRALAVPVAEAAAIEGRRTEGAWLVSDIDLVSPDAERLPLTR
jgi:hypothetical protein